MEQYSPGKILMVHYIGYILIYPKLKQKSIWCIFVDFTANLNCMACSISEHSKIRYLQNYVTGGFCVHANQNILHGIHCTTSVQDAPKERSFYCHYWMNDSYFSAGKWNHTGKWGDFGRFIRPLNWVSNNSWVGPLQMSRAPQLDPLRYFFPFRYLNYIIWEGSTPKSKWLSPKL